MNRALTRARTDHEEQEHHARHRAYLASENDGGTEATDACDGATQSDELYEEPAEEQEHDDLEPRSPAPEEEDANDFDEEVWDGDARDAREELEVRPRVWGRTGERGK